MIELTQPLWNIVKLRAFGRHANRRVNHRAWRGNLPFCCALEADANSSDFRLRNLASPCSLELAAEHPHRQRIAECDGEVAEPLVSKRCAHNRVLVAVVPRDRVRRFLDRAHDVGRFLHHHRFGRIAHDP